MNQLGFTVLGRTFRNRNDYMAAKRDEERISKIRDKVDLTSMQEVIEVKRNLEDKRYHFETLIGDDFYDEICELIKQLKTEPKETVHSSKKKIHKTGSIAKQNINKPEKHIKEKKKSDNPLSLDEYDSFMQQEIIRQLKKRDRRNRLIVSFLSILAAGCIGYVGYYYFYYEKNDIDYNNLADLKDETTGYTVTLTGEENKDKPPILKKYETLYNKNKRLIGWLKIDDTNIDYPVMQTVNNDYYLDHNYNQEYDKNGSLFLDKDCDAAFPNTNMIIYGHHMKSGKMFGNLNYYSKESYFKEHPQIQFDTIYEEGLYDVMYVFRSRIYSEEEVIFKYYQFFDVTSADEFYSNMEEMANLSLYDTGVTANYGDKLITLSTCDSSEEDGRFVVVAKKVK